MRSVSVPIAGGSLSLFLPCLVLAQLDGTRLQWRRNEDEIDAEMHLGACQQ